MTGSYQKILTQLATTVTNQSLSNNNSDFGSSSVSNTAGYVVVGAVAAMFLCGCLFKVYRRPLPALQINPIDPEENDHDREFEGLNFP
jgi:hypothetical protein